MSIKSDRWIRRMVQEHRMIEPFGESQVREGVISYGVSSYGYDMRVGREFRIFTNVHSPVVDPKNFDPLSLVDHEGDVCIIPSNIEHGGYASDRGCSVIDIFSPPRQDFVAKAKAVRKGLEK